MEEDLEEEETFGVERLAAAAAGAAEGVAGALLLVLLLLVDRRARAMTSESAERETIGAVEAAEAAAAASFLASRVLRRTSFGIFFLRLRKRMFFFPFSLANDKRKSRELRITSECR